MNYRNILNTFTKFKTLDKLPGEWLLSRPTDSDVSIIVRDVKTSTLSETVKIVEETVKIEMDYNAEYHTKSKQKYINEPLSF